MFALTPDGGRVVYTADQDRTDCVEIYCVGLDGSGLRKLNGPLVAGSSVVNFGVSPLSDRVLYVADALEDEVFELFGVTLAGSNAVRLNAAPVQGGDVVVSPGYTQQQPFAVSPDGSRVVYIADQNTDGVYELYSAPVAGGRPPVKLSGAMTEGGNVASFAIDAASGRVVYMADQDELGMSELYSVPLAGGEAVKLNPPPMGRGEVFWYMLAPDGERVVFTSGRTEDLLFQLFSVNTAGGGLISLDAWLPARSWTLDFDLSPDGRRVIYRAGQAMDYLLDLYGVPTDGGTLLRLTGAMAEGEFPQAYEASGDRVVFLAGTAGGVLHLYSVPIAGGTPQLIDPMPAAAMGLYECSHAVTPDDQYVIFKSDPESDGVYELYSAPLPPL